MRTITLTDADVAADADKLAGTFVDLRHCDRVLSDTTTVLKPDGSILLIYVKDSLPRCLCRAAFDAYKNTRPTTLNRGLAAGGPRPVPSGAVGFLDRSPLLPYCRMTAFTKTHLNSFKALRPLVSEVSRQFQQLAPDRWEAQRAFVESLPAKFVIPGSVFTTVTMNRTFRTAAHRDEGDYQPGLGILTAMGCFEGGELVFPRFHTAVDMRTGSLCLADVHELHGNAPMWGRRLSFVFYAREGMAECDRER